MEKIMIVAECGVNWNGDLDLAQEMIEASADLGADAVKFQLFSEEQIKNSQCYKRLKEMILDFNSLKELKLHADVLKIEFSASAMYPKAIDWLNKLGCNYIKIREKDSENYDLIEKALTTKKTVFISATKRPIDKYYLWNPRIRWLYCLPHYPPHPEQFDLNLAATYDGISSHFPHYTLDLAVATVALAKYNKPYIIEKHVVPMIGHTFGYWEEPDKSCIDFPVSINFNQLKELVSHVKRLEQLTIRE